MCVILLPLSLLRGPLGMGTFSAVAAVESVGGMLCLYWFGKLELGHIKRKVYNGRSNRWPKMNIAKQPCVPKEAIKLFLQFSPAYYSLLYSHFVYLNNRMLSGRKLMSSSLSGGFLLYGEILLINVLLENRPCITFACLAHATSRTNFKEVT